jgi:hypothetical protein
VVLSLLAVVDLVRERALAPILLKQQLATRLHLRADVGQRLRALLGGNAEIQ